MTCMSDTLRGRHTDRSVFFTTPAQRAAAGHHSPSPIGVIICRTMFGPPRPAPARPAPARPAPARPAPAMPAILAWSPQAPAHHPVTVTVTQCADVRADRVGEPVAACGVPVTPPITGPFSVRIARTPEGGRL